MTWTVLSHPLFCTFTLYLYLAVIFKIRSRGAVPLHELRARSAFTNHTYIFSVLVLQQLGLKTRPLSSETHNLTAALKTSTVWSFLVLCRELKQSKTRKKKLTSDWLIKIPPMFLYFCSYICTRALAFLHLFKRSLLHIARYVILYFCFIIYFLFAIFILHVRRDASSSPIVPVGNWQ